MQALRFALRNLWRDLKSGELSVLLLALSIAVLSLTAVGFFTSRVSQAVHAQAAEVLAADLRLESPHPLPDRYFDEAARRGLKWARIISFPTAIFNGDANQLTALNAVTAAYPLRGRVRIADQPFGPARPATGVPGRGEVWLDARVLAQLDLARGGELRIGAATFRITQVLDYRPDQGTGFVNLAPAALIDYADIDATQLIQPGSRASYEGLFSGSADSISDFRTYLEAAKGAGERLRDVADSSRQLNSAIDRAGRFLNLASLNSVLLAAIAVAMGARRYAARHIDAVALMKCMGASQSFVLAISIIELALLGVAAVAIGSALGYLAQSGLAYILRDLVRNDLPPASLAPLPVALVTVLAMLIGFALPPLLQLRNTPPARVLRRSLSAPPLRYGLAYLLGLAALAGMLWTQVRDGALVLWVMGGVLAVAVLLTLGGFALVRITGRLRGGVGVAWRYGLANVSRRGQSSVVQIVAFGLGLLVLLLLAVVRGDLLNDWKRSLPADVPNNFMINIRPEEREALQAFLAQHGFGSPPLYPMVRARMTAANGISATELMQRDEANKGFLEREQNLTWSADLMPDNQLTAGRWWGPDDLGKPLVSVSSEYADGLKLKVGDQLSFDVAGEPLTVTVASIRKIRWDSFRPNFFLVFPPKLLDGAAGTYMTARLSHAAAAPGAGAARARLPNGLGVRRRRHPQADPRDHGSGHAGGAVRVPVHPGRGRRGAAGGGAVDARRTPL